MGGLVGGEDVQRQVNPCFVKVESISSRGSPSPTSMPLYPPPHFQVLPDAQVDRGDISSAGMAGRVRGGQPARIQALDASKSC